MRQHLLVVQAGVGYLSKPFSPDQLAARVRSALDAPEPARGGTTSRGDPP